MPWQKWDLLPKKTRREYRSTLLALLLGLLGGLLLGCQTPAEENEWEPICGPFYIKKQDSLFSGDIFTKNEKLLFCGSDTPGWKKIPDTQAQYFIKNFLVQSGYLNPRFTKNEGKILVDLGPQTEIHEIQFLNAPQEFFESTFLGVKDQPLTSENLDKIENWALQRLKTLGYPCPQVSTRVDEKRGLVTLEIKPGNKERIHRIEPIGLVNIKPLAIYRFYAFDFGSFYNIQNLELSSRRLLQSGLVNSSAFHSRCQDSEREQGVLDQNLSFGEPRQLILNLGGTTEEFPIASARWKHSRVDDLGSQAEVELYLSSVRQSLNGEMNWYTFASQPRLFWRPDISFSRLSERLYESLSQKLSFGLGQALDDSQHRYQWLVSPTYNVEKTLVGAGPEHTSFFSLDLNFNLIDHDYEFFQTSPRKGYTFNFDWSTRQRGLGSEINANRYLIDATYLINWGGFDPPLTVFGLRLKYGIFETNRPAETPTSYRLYLGGDDDLRGFPRKSLNNQGLGFSSFAYLGTELRFLRILPYDFQPFLLFDVAKVAVEEVHYLPATLMSPGAGMRWQSPFGSFRSTLAYGTIDNHKRSQLGPTDQWKFFLSFGKEF